MHTDFVLFLYLYMILWGSIYSDESTQTLSNFVQELIMVINLKHIFKNNNLLSVIFWPVLTSSPLIINIKFGPPGAFCFVNKCSCYYNTHRLHGKQDFES